MNILVLNCGSSSLKYQLIDYSNKKVLAKGLCERIGIENPLFSHKDINGFKIDKASRVMKNHGDAVNLVVSALIDKEHGIIKSLDEIDAIGHRVLHGGPYFTEPAVVNAEVKAAIRECFTWGPLHNPANLTGIEVCEQIMPNIKQVAVFDTAFHMTMPERAFMYGIPYEYYEKYKIRRYGFHGTSHAYVSDRVSQITKKDPKSLKLVTCHLGNGSSFAAIKGGKCQDTSMGLTPLAGILMGSRSGDIDPAIVPFLQEKEQMSAKEVDTMLNKKSGVAGISGVSSDFRDLDQAAAAGNKRAKLALDMFKYQAKKIIGSYAAALNGLDALVFTAGIGENDAAMRKEICEGLSYLGIKIDDKANQERGEKLISTQDSKVEVYVIPTNEELSIARQTVEILGLK